MQIVFLPFLNFLPGLSISCIQCNTELSGTKKCPQDFEATECPENATLCRKIEQESESFHQIAF